MSEIPLYMTHDLKNVPNFSLPDGYHFRFYGCDGDAEAWAKIVTKTDEFANEEKAMERFNEEFSPHINEAEKRIVFIVTNHGDLVGTATAWYGVFNGKNIGRLHWIEIIPEYQGKKLGRPLISKAMNVLKKYHSYAYLKTQRSSEAAIHLYQKLGWIPVIQDEREKEIWKAITQGRN